METKLKLKNGAFYRGNEKVPMEIGNAEQIALLKKRERNIADAEENGIGCDFDVEDISFDAEISFECICGAQVNDSRHVSFAERADDDAAEAEWDLREVTCCKCGMKYEIEDGIARLKN